MSAFYFKRHVKKIVNTVQLFSWVTTRTTIQLFTYKQQLVEIPTELPHTTFFQ